jgi:GNAT superfamily N-acetyltransferase
MPFRFRPISLRGATRGFLDLEIRTDAAVDIRIVERPGRWLDDDALEALLADMRQVVQSSLDGNALDYGVVGGSRRRLDDSIVTVIYAKGTDRLAMVDPEYRGHGLSWALYGLTVMLIFFRRQMRPLWISNVTQVPAVLGLVDSGFTNVYPTLHGKRAPTFAHLTIARQIMRHHRDAFGVGPEATFDAHRFVVTNSYTGGSDNLKKTFDETAKHRDEAYNALCLRELDYQRGDDFLQLGQYDLSVARRYLLRSVPRRSLPSLLGSAGFLLLGSILLPIVHWFSVHTAMGDVRPARS